MGKYNTRHDQAGEDASEAAHGVAADTKYHYLKRNLNNYEKKVEIFLTNQILSSILIDQMHPWNGGKYIALNEFGYGYFSAYYTIDNKPDPSYEYQPDYF